MSLTYAAKTRAENVSEYYSPSNIYLNYYDYQLTESPSMRLCEVLVTNRDSQIVERMTLQHDYAQEGTPKMFLRLTSSMQKGTHQFSYNDDVRFPLNNTGSTDHWGYWNGRSYSSIKDITVFDGSRYSQMTSTAKDPDPEYAVAAALTRITYPTGGSTSIEYEGNIAERGLEEEGRCHEPAEEFAVGGVRVKSMTDRKDMTDAGRVTHFSYTDGFLFHMPRYRMEVPIDYIYAESYTYEGDGQIVLSKRADYVNKTVIAYGADSDYDMSRDCNIGYGAVQVTSPDGSFTLHSFSNYSGEYADGFMPDNMYQVFTKRGNFELMDFIETQEGTYSSYIAYPCSDRRNMRGRPLSVSDYDAEGTLLQRKEYSYTYDTVSLNWIYFNNLDTFIRMPWECRSAILSEERTTDYRYGTTLTTIRQMDYNSLGQIACETISSPQDPDRTVSTSYSYLHQDGCHAGTLPSAISCAQRSVMLLGSTYELQRKDFFYENFALHSRPSRTSLCAPFMNSAGRSTLFLRDNLFRETQVTLPGSQHIWYVWSGNNLGSSASGTAANRKGYSWKDLVGLTGMTLPDGRTQTCTYSERNRPWEHRDSDNNTISSNQIQLRYE